MNKELAKTLTTALVQFIDRERPEGTMCCSNIECESIEQMLEGEHFDIVEAFIQKKLLRLTEFEQEVSDVVEYCKEHGENVAFDYAKRHAKTLLALAKKELLSYADESNPAIEAMADLERTFECNPEKLPLWLQGKLGKKHLEGYIMGREDTMREMKDFIESHFNNEKAKDETYHKNNPESVPNGIIYKAPNNWNDVMVAPNINSGTSTAKMEG